MLDLKLALDQYDGVAETMTARPRPLRLVAYFRPHAHGPLARERAGEIVRDAIVGGRIAPGTRLIERELCEALGVSRTVVREVIRDLEAERLIEVVPHRGPSVATLTPKMVREVYELRAELEAMFIRAYVRVATETDFADLRGILADLRAAGERRDRAALVESITRFLHHMVEVADNQVGAEMFDQLLARINMLRMMAMEAPGQIENSIVEISELVARIEARDADGAERVLRAYTAGARDSALSQLRLARTREPAKDIV
jgi:DNA-binding GntR family transcriptional regulator